MPMLLTYCYMGIMVSNYVPVYNVVHHVLCLRFMSGMNARFGPNQRSTNPQARAM